MKSLQDDSLRLAALARDQSRLTDAVVAVANPDFIFLLGSLLHRRRRESIFGLDAPEECRLGEPVLLVTVPAQEVCAAHEWQEKIEQRCASLVPLTALVVETSVFRKWLQAGHPFARTVVQRASRWLAAEALSLPEEPVPVRTFDDRAFATGLSVAREFLAGADLYRIRKQHTMAAFMLHQAAEQALCGLVKLGTGYRAVTHSVERLLRYAALVSSRLPDLFAGEAERRLLRLLQTAYVESRYNDAYRITAQELAALTGKVHTIAAIVDETGNALIEGWLPSSELREESGSAGSYADRALCLAEDSTDYQRPFVFLRGGKLDRCA